MDVTDDLTHPSVIEEPYEYYGTLRETRPVYHNEKWGGYIVTRFDNVKECFQDNEHLSRESEMERLPADTEASNFLSKWLIFRDPPAHTRLRSLTLEAFNTQAIESLRPDVQQTVESLVADLERQCGSDIGFIEDFSYPLPVLVISKMLGIPKEDRDRIKDWSSDLMLTVQHFYGADSRRERTEQAMREFSTYMQGIVDDRRESPRDDLISHLIEAQAEGQMLDDDEVIATAMFLLVAGHETTTNLIANGLKVLFDHPDQMALLREDPDLVPGAVEEILRYQGTVKAITREVTADFELDGRTVEDGKRVMLNVAAANRDPRAFEDPETFDVTRAPEDHLAFGGGIHFCLGAPLARMETEIALTELLQAFPELEPATEDVSWRRSPTIRSMKALPVRI